MMFQTGGVTPNDTSANTLSGSVMVNVPVNGAAPESIVTVTVATIAPRTVLSDTCGTATGEILITGCGGGGGGGGPIWSIVIVTLREIVVITELFPFVYL